MSHVARGPLWKISAAIWGRERIAGYFGENRYVRHTTTTIAPNTFDTNINIS